MEVTQNKPCLISRCINPKFLAGFYEPDGNWVCHFDDVRCSDETLVKKIFTIILCCFCSKLSAGQLYFSPKPKISTHSPSSNIILSWMFLWGVHGDNKNRSWWLYGQWDFLNSTFLCALGGKGIKAQEIILN